MRKAAKIGVLIKYCARKVLAGERTLEDLITEYQLTDKEIQRVKDLVEGVKNFDETI